MSFKSKDSKHWTIPRSIMSFIVGLSMLSYVSYISYGFSRSIMSTYSKSSLIDENDPSWIFFEKLKPCSINSLPCKDIPDYFKGMIQYFDSWILENFMKFSIWINSRKSYMEFNESKSMGIWNQISTTLSRRECDQICQIESVPFRIAKSRQKPYQKPTQ